MIDAVIAFSLRRRGVVLFLAFLGALAGTAALLRLPVDVIPDLSEPQVLVHAAWQGRSATEVEREVTSPLTASLRGLPGVRAVRATSEFGVAMVAVLFEDRTDRADARGRVDRAISAARGSIPPEVVPEMGPEASAVGHIVWFTIEGGGEDLASLRTLLRRVVRPRLAAVPGVAEVALAGGMDREWHVETTPERLRSLGVTLEEVHAALDEADADLGAAILVHGNAEHGIRPSPDARGAEDLEHRIVASRGRAPVTVGDVATVSVGPATRRCVLERDGREAVGGVVVLRDGENPRAVTAAVLRALRDVAPALPPGVRVVPFYERTRLIDGAIAGAATTLTTEAVVAAVVVLLGMLHVGASAVVALTIPLAVVGTAAAMHLLRIPANLMSLAGIAVSIGVLLDQAIVLCDNAMHRLRERFGDAPVRGDIRDLLVAPCREVGRPVFFGVLVLVVSFLPVFALGGIEGRMFHPLAWTKTLVMGIAGVLTVTVVPALLPTLLRGRIPGEERSWIVRSVASVYRPVLDALLDRPVPVVAGFLLLLAFAVGTARGLGSEFLPPLDEGQILDMPVTTPRVGIEQAANDLRARNAVLRSFPEVEGVVGKAGRAETATDPSPLEMVETVVTLRPEGARPARQVERSDIRRTMECVQAEVAARGRVGAPTEDDSAADERIDAVARDVDEALRRLARVRRDEAAPLIAAHLATRLVEETLAVLRAEGQIDRDVAGDDVDVLARGLDPALGAALAAAPLPADVVRGAREVAECLRAAGRLANAETAFAASAPRTVLALLTGTPDDVFDRLHGRLTEAHASAWSDHTRSIVPELERAAAYAVAAAALDRAIASFPGHPAPGAIDAVERAAILDTVVGTPTLRLRTKSRAELVAEMDATLRVPGWANIWTQPIVNRIDMLTTGIRTEVGVKVLGSDLAVIERVSLDVAAAVRGVHGAADVFAPRAAERSHIDVEIDPVRCALLGVRPDDVTRAIGLALGSREAARFPSEGEDVPVRVRYARDARTDMATLGRIEVPVRDPGAREASAVRTTSVEETGSRLPRTTAHGSGHGRRSGAGSSSSGPAAEVADSGLATPPVVELREVATLRSTQGPAMVQSEDGLLCGYVQMNVRGRDVVGFVEEARRVVEARVHLPSGTSLVWSGQFEHHVRARRTLLVVVPAVVLAILAILWITFRDTAHALLLLTAIPGALAGGVLFQAALGIPFSVAVWVGYAACFGLATETGIVMLVYLRASVAARGGIERIESLECLRTTVLDGAVRRLRPKVLTEATTLLGLAPMLWASGSGSEVFAPMAAPLVGGILVADEVIDLLLPVLFFAVERRRWVASRSLAGTREVTAT